MNFPPPQELNPADTKQVMDILRKAQSGYGIPRWSESSLLLEIEGSLSLVTRGFWSEVEAFILFRSVVDAYEISYLATSPSSQRKGLMRGLLARAAWLAKDQGIGLWLEVHEKNISARALYEKFGFTQVGQRPYYYADKGTAILYSYRPI